MPQRGICRSGRLRGRAGHAHPKIIDELGGGLRDDRRLRSIQVGGPLGGFLAPDELDVPLLESALAAYGVALGHASLIAIDDRVSAAALLRHVWRFAAMESCGTCAPCRIGSGRGAALAERIVAGDTSALAEQQPLLATLETASMCAFGRGVPASVRSLCGSTPTSWRHESNSRRTRS